MKLTWPKVKEFLKLVVVLGTLALMTSIRIEQEDGQKRGATRDAILCQVARDNDLIMPTRCEEVLRDAEKVDEEAD